MGDSSLTRYFIINLIIKQRETAVKMGRPVTMIQTSWPTVWTCCWAMSVGVLALVSPCCGMRPQKLVNLSMEVNLKLRQYS